MEFCKFADFVKMQSTFVDFKIHTPFETIDDADEIVKMDYYIYNSIDICHCVIMGLYLATDFIQHIPS